MNTAKTIMEEQKQVDKYLQQVGQYDLLSAEEEQTLLAQALDGDKSAFDKVLCANLRYTVSLTARYKNRGLSLIQLFEVSKQGLANAIMASASKPQGERLVRFALPFIRQAIVKKIREVRGATSYMMLQRMTQLDEKEM